MANDSEMGFIPVNRPSLLGNEKQYLSECIETGWISSEGPFVEEFERKVADWVGRKHAVAVANGTAALDIAIEALDIGFGDEVIVPTFTIISCVLQIIRSGATPVFVDCDPYTFNVDVDHIRAKLTKRTKAVMVVHIYGLPVDIDPITELCCSEGVYLIEDAAELIGQTYKSRLCGSFGDISTFSFYPNKHITTGEGGMVLTDDDRTAAACRELRNLCFQSGKRFVHERLGWNYRMTNLQAALGLAQLEQINHFVERKHFIGGFYNECFEDLKGVQLPVSRTSYADNIYWVYTLVLDDSLGTADLAMELLSRKYKIGSRPFFYPLHKQPVFGSTSAGLAIAPVAERLYHQGLYIPSGLGITNIELEHVARSVRAVIGELRS